MKKTHHGKKIYIAAPLYSSGDVEENMRKVCMFASVLRAYNFVPFVPHLNHYWNKISWWPEAEWLMWDLIWLSECDAIVRLEGESKGGDLEIAYARRVLGIPEFHRGEPTRTRELIDEMETYFAAEAEGGEDE